MSRLRVAPVVEGHGEVGCIRVLFQRVWVELLSGEFIEVVRPIRRPRGNLVKPEGLRATVRLAVKKLNELPESADPKLVLVLFDADTDCPARLGPELLELGRDETAPGVGLACVLANVEYETWFAASAESLSRYLDLTRDDGPPQSPEGSRHGKMWVEPRFRGRKYSETQDQPAMTSAMDLALCRRRAPSFDKLCRELERRLPRPTPAD